MGIRDGHWADGTLVVTNTAGDSEVLAGTMTGLTELALADIPDAASAILAGAPALAYRITARDWSAQVELLNLGEFALTESIADLAHFELGVHARRGAAWAGRRTKSATARGSSSTCNCPPAPRCCWPA